MTKGYEPNRNLLASVENVVGTTVLSRYEYGNDALGRRTRRADSLRRIDSAELQSATNDFGYNARSELTNAVMPVLPAGWDWEGATNVYGWSFDGIGNRQSYTTNGAAHGYAANELNQYTQITNGGTRNLAYDPDGNLTNDGVWVYSWDGENRLISASNATKVVTFRYDYMSRRVEKAVDTWAGSAWVSASTNVFVWDGWLLVSETHHSSIPSPQSSTNFYVWGLDLSQSLQGAGGIGGLLWTHEMVGSWTNGSWYFYDGNGNVGQTVHSEGGYVRMERDYDAYGNVTHWREALDGPKPPIRFSTKYWDNETGLGYWGYRYYRPEDFGRWLSKDCMEEEGGLNFYGMCQNNAVSYTDAKGCEILDLKIRGEGQSKIEKNCWEASLEDLYREVALKDDLLGYHGGYGTYQASASLLSPSGKAPPAVKVGFGLFKFEYEVKERCPEIDPADRVTGNYKSYSLKQYVSNAYRKWQARGGGEWEEDVLAQGEKDDGPTLQVVKYGDPFVVVIQYAADAPRTPYPYTDLAGRGGKWPGKIAGYKYIFGATWRVRVEDNDNAWEGKFRVAYQFSDSSPEQGKGTLTIIEAPHEVK